ncbi:MAG: hypothetical protein Q8862_03875 [Bacteroidota bacterium]|nr:hypothetical protein [Bacteroidota bacterium]MDP4205155.1 hypothetical protein [Bacteroidota bacterium]
MDNLRIENEEEYRWAVLRYLEIFDAPENTSEWQEAMFLCMLMKEYEEHSCREMHCGESWN